MNTIKGDNPQRLKALLVLHLLLMLYSVTGIFSKLASGVPFLGFEFCLYYAGLLAILGVYAIGWQQLLKRLPLTTAFSNKAVTIVWGIIWGVVFFAEAITVQKIIGALLIMAGIVLFTYADTKYADSAGSSLEDEELL